MTNPDLDFAVRQRVMHRTSQVDALCYQYGWGRAEAEAKYDADTEALIETGELPALPPSPDVSGSMEPHEEPTVVEEAAQAVEEGDFREPEPQPELPLDDEPSPPNDAQEA